MTRNFPFYLYKNGYPLLVHANQETNQETNQEELPYFEEPYCVPKSNESLRHVLLLG